MTMVSILPITTDGDGTTFRAVSGEKHSTGRTVGEALDALTAQLSDEEVGTLVLVRSPQFDPLFNRSRQDRFTSLMDRWREARDEGEELGQDEQGELNALIEAELRASGERANALADALGR